jgi:cation transport protein ChaC
MSPDQSQPGAFWVFGYGSLIWNPGFTFTDRRRATLSGWRRAFCMSSIVYRGTPDRPGLVLALDQDEDAACHGVAYRVAGTEADATLAYLRERELVSYAYRETRLPLTLEGDEIVEAVAFVVKRDHAQYRGGLSLAEQADVIASAIGPRGPNAEYLANTIAGLEALGLPDADLARLSEMVRARIDPDRHEAHGSATRGRIDKPL